MAAGVLMVWPAIQRSAPGTRRGPPPPPARPPRPPPAAPPPQGPRPGWEGGPARGPGARPTRRGRVFEACARGGDACSPAGGSGLGLAIVHRIVTDHHGSVWVEDNEPSGTVFNMEFPQG